MQKFYALTTLSVLLTTTPGMIDDSASAQASSAHKSDAFGSYGDTGEIANGDANSNSSTHDDFFNDSSMEEEDQTIEDFDKKYMNEDD